MLNHEQPIGIFDSGVGGLTVAQAINELLPQEDIIYFGDTAHTPWGNQSTLSVSYYASNIAKFLLEQNCKIIVIACNTGSALAINAVKQVVADKALVFNVIDPVVDYVAQNYQNKNIGLIGTKQTVRSQAYTNRLLAKCDSVTINSLATPSLVPLIEEGLSNSKPTKELIAHYLSNPKLENISALILGCTHYPLIKNQIADYYNNQIEILDSAQIIATLVASELTQNNLLNKENSAAKMTFYVSDDSSFFNDTAQRFFPSNIDLQTYPLWEQVKHQVLNV